MIYLFYFVLLAAIAVDINFVLYLSSFVFLFSSLLLLGLFANVLHFDHAEIPAHSIVSCCKHLLCLPQTSEAGPVPLSRTESGILKKPWVLGMMYQQKSSDDLSAPAEPTEPPGADKKRLDLDLRQDSVRDLRQKLLSQSSPLSPADERTGRIGDSSGIISKAKQDLSRSKSKHDVIKSAEALKPAVPETPKKSENDLHWEQLMRSLQRPLVLCDLDFSDLNEGDDVNATVLTLSMNGGSGGVPPPPPGPPPPPPLGGPPPPPRLPGMPPPPPPAPNARAGAGGQSSYGSDRTNGQSAALPNKTKKTVKLFWREVSALTSLGLLVLKPLSPFYWVGRSVIQYPHCLNDSVQLTCTLINFSFVLVGGATPHFLFCNQFCITWCWLAGTSKAHLECRLLISSLHIAIQAIKL